jgi:predicted RNA-binding Zn-ribbon protein involved in translation (DUF1610 family)
MTHSTDFDFEVTPRRTGAGSRLPKSSRLRKVGTVRRFGSAVGATVLYMIAAGLVSCVFPLALIGLFGTPLYFIYKWLFAMQAEANCPACGTKTAVNSLRAGITCPCCKHRLIVRSGYLRSV